MINMLQLYIDYVTDMFLRYISAGIYGSAYSSGVSYVE